MKKALILVGMVVAVFGAVMVKQNQNANAEAELWAEATDPLSPTERLQA